MLCDPRFKYLPKTKEILISILKQNTLRDSVYEINLKENKFKTIKALTAKGLTKKPFNEKALAKNLLELYPYFHHYRLKIK